MSKKKDIFAVRESFKPFHYPQFYDFYLKHEKIHWIPTEIPLHEDTNDWSNKLTDKERGFLNNVFLLFTESDRMVSEGYVKTYLPKFNHTEIRMMLMSFANREAVHIDSYSYLLETLGKPDSFYDEFHQIPIMQQKKDYFDRIITADDALQNLPLQIAGISAFTEGMFLFSSFVMLLTFPRSGKMKGMGTIVKYSILDETLHFKGLFEIFKVIIKENKTWWNDDTKRSIYELATKMTELEFGFIDYVYDNYVEFGGLNRDDLKHYIKYIVDRRLLEMGLKGIHTVKKNPLPWVDEMINSQSHESFFEARSTSYAKGATTGSWNEVWGAYNVNE